MDIHHSPHTGLECTAARAFIRVKDTFGWTRVAKDRTHRNVVGSTMEEQSEWETSNARTAFHLLNQNVMSPQSQHQPQQNQPQPNQQQNVFRTTLNQSPRTPTARKSTLTETTIEPKKNTARPAPNTTTPTLHSLLPPPPPPTPPPPPPPPSSLPSVQLETVQLPFVPATTGAPYAAASTSRPPSPGHSIPTTSKTTATTTATAVAMTTTNSKNNNDDNASITSYSILSRTPPAESDGPTPLSTPTTTRRRRFGGPPPLSATTGPSFLGTLVGGGGGGDNYDTRSSSNNNTNTTNNNNSNSNTYHFGTAPSTPTAAYTSNASVMPSSSTIPNTTNTLPSLPLRILHPPLGPLPLPTPRPPEKCALLACFYAEFDNKVGPKVCYQSPRGFMDQPVNIPLTRVYDILRDAFAQIAADADPTNRGGQEGRQGGGGGGRRGEGKPTDLRRDAKRMDESSPAASSSSSSSPPPSSSQQPITPASSLPSGIAAATTATTSTSAAASSHETTTTTTTIMDSIFDSCSEFIITGSELTGKIINLSTHQIHCLSRPTILSDERYERNALLFSIGFILRRTEDPRPFRPVLSKLAMVLRDMEWESQFLSHEATRPHIQVVLEHLLVSLNSSTGNTQWECNLLLPPANVLHLKLFHPPQRPAAPVPDYAVPILLRRDRQVQMVRFLFILTAARTTRCAWLACLTMNSTQRSRPCLFTGSRTGSMTGIWPLTGCHYTLTERPMPNKYRHAPKLTWKWCELVSVSSSITGSLPWWICFFTRIAMNVPNNPPRSCPLA